MKDESLLTKEEYYGNRVPLEHFREFPEYYQELLKAVQEVLESREIYMPYIEGDVFGRHALLGGIHLLRQLTEKQLQTFRHKKQKFVDPSFGRQQEKHQSHQIQLADLYDGSTRRDIFHLLFDQEEVPDPIDQQNLRLLRDFHTFACQQNDIFVMPRQSPFESPRYTLKIGGYTLETAPPLGKSVFFGEQTSAQKEGVYRRFHKQPIHDPAD